ncbi:MAG TPA: hypothetical protein VFH51_08870, partial [Myxococcota bacterium]|nr:hypothetical protein [Myxococcota bacterium]
EQAFDRGVYGEAFVAWHQGLEIDPDNEALAAALAKLEARATGLLTAIPTASGDAEACTRLREIVSMTRPGHPTHAAAAGRLSSCK